MRILIALGALMIFNLVSLVILKIIKVAMVPGGDWQSLTNKEKRIA